MAFRNTAKSISGSQVPFYVCPAAYEAVVHSLFCTNTGTTDLTIDIQLTTALPSSPGVVGTFYIIKGIHVSAGSTLILDKSINLRSGDTLRGTTAGTCDVVAAILLTATDTVAPQ